MNKMRNVNIFPKRKFKKVNENNNIKKKTNSIINVANNK